MSEIIKQKIQNILNKFLHKLDDIVDIDWDEDDIENIKSCQSKAGQDKKLTKEAKV